MSKAEEIRARLQAAFSPEVLDVINESEQHRGHGGYSDGESHFRVVIKAAGFADMTRVARHRAVHSALGAELVAQIHALALEISG
ncbi:MAG TPA: BolA family transcriptional regulator [Aliiroseovarius sp.]|nr:BolA family transcriptional regulator [Aliiroseovarius sp.]